MANYNLTAEQQANYASVNQRFGLEALAGTYDLIEHTGTNLFFSGDALQSSIVPKLISVDSIAEMNRLIGSPDTGDDSSIEYPDAFPADKSDLLAKVNSKQALLNLIDDQIRANLGKAARAYVTGNPAKVAAYEPLINAMFFPMHIAYFAAPQTLVVDHQITVTGSIPVVWNYPEIIFKNGGSITADVDFTINCNSMSKES